ncbi:MAG: hypothetical protein WCP09_02550 [Candidatus Taylorbacteria bacterium]
MRKIFYFIIPLCIAVPIMVFGQTTAPTTSSRATAPQSNVEPTTVASLSIENLKYSYDNVTRQVLVFFDLVNDQESIPDVNYSLSIISDNGIRKDFVYNKNIFLAKGASVSQGINEIVPEYIFGNITLLLQAKSSSGVPLGVRIRKGIEIKPTLNTAYLDSSSCYLSVADSTKYNLTQGVDIDPTEQLYINCSVINILKNPYTLVPKIKTYERSISGKLVEESKLSETFIDKATSTVKILIPVPNKPQAYTSILSLNSGGISIGEVSLHYVVRGESGTASLVQMDKLSYLSGDIAKAKILWSPRADSFPGARASSTDASGSFMGKLSILKSGTPCADPVTFSPSKTADQNIELDVPITTDCNGYETKVEVKDSNNNDSIAAVSYKTPAVIFPLMTNWLQYVIALAVLIVVLAILAVVVAIIKRRRKFIDSIFVSVVILFLVSFLSVRDVRAYLFTVLFTSDGGSVYMTFFGDFEVTDFNSEAKTTFIKGAGVRITDYKTKMFLRCANNGGAYDSVQSKVTVTRNGVSQILRNYTSVCDSSSLSDYCYNHVDWLPIYSGTYTVTVTFRALETNSTAWGNEYSYSKTITVIEPKQLDISFTGTGASQGKVNLANASESSCIGPSLCTVPVAVNSTVSVTNAIARSTTLNTNNLTCTISNPGSYYMATYSGSISGGTTPYVIYLKNVITNGSPVSYYVSYVPSYTQFRSLRTDTSSAYVEVSSADGQMSQVSCGGASVPNLTRGYTQFTGWAGACSGTGSCSVLMNTDKSVQAGYNWVPLTPNHNPSVPVVTSASSCSDITGNMPYKLSFVMTDPDSDQVQLYEDKGYPSYYQPYGSMMNSGSSVIYSKSYTTTGVKTINFKVYDVNGANSTIYSTTTTIVAKCAPVVTLVADPISIVTSASSSLSWSSVNATACVTSGDWPSPQTSTTSAKLTGGKLSTGILSVAKTYSYSMSCTGTGGKSATSTVTVSAANVVPLALTCSANNTSVPPQGLETIFRGAISASDPGTGPYYWNNMTSSSVYNATNTTIFYQNGTTSPPTFSVKDSSNPQRIGNVACAPIRLETTLMKCDLKIDGKDNNVVASPGYNMPVTWSSTNALSCIVDPMDWKDLSGGKDEYNVNVTETNTYTLSCTNTRATPPICTDSITLRMVTGDGIPNAVVWFDSQFPNVSEAPDNVQASKKTLSVQEGTTVKIGNSWNENLIASCKGVTISGPSNNGWTNTSLPNNTLKILPSNLSVGTYKLSMTCDGIPSEESTVETYTSNTIRLIVTKSILKEN